MRLHPALALAAVLLPALAAAQTDEWVRDDMSDDSLWLLRTSNLAREAPRAGTLPGAPDGGSHWVMSQGDGPAYVVYFIPGRIHEVEIDTHRLAGSSGDFTLAVSTDGKLYQPLDAGAVLLDTSFGWDYRLMASDQIPENATHLLVQFPDGSTAHSLSEVWIRYTWDDALVSRFLPEPVAAPQRQETLAAHSDAELQAMVEALMTQAAPPAAREVLPLVEQTPASSLPALMAEPLRAPNTVENAAPVQFPAPDVVGSATASVEFAKKLPDEAHDSHEAVPAVTESPGNVAAPASDILPIDPAAVEMPIAVATEPDAAIAAGENADAIQKPEGETAPLATADTADAGDSIASPPTGNLAPVDEPQSSQAAEEVHVLPTFTLPVIGSAESSEAAASPQFEPPPPATADSVVLEPATPMILSAPAVEPEEPDSIEVNLPAVDAPPTGTVSLESPAMEPGPTSIAAPALPVAPSESSDPAEITTDDEPKAKPAMKMKRMGPRSKSRGTLIARD